MKLDVSKKLVDLEGKPINERLTVVQGKEVKCPKCGEEFKVDALIPDDRPLILRNVLINALLTPPQKAIRAESKMTRESLARRIHDEDVVDFNVKELAMLGELCDERYQEPLLYAQVARAIEGEKKEDETEATEPPEKKK